MQMMYIDEENVLKMSRGIALTDEDRYPWLHALSLLLAEHERHGLVLACSALKESYRKLLSSRLRDAFKLIYLKGCYKTIYTQISIRENHFFSPEMLLSQFEELEEPEAALIIDLDTKPLFADEVMNLIP